jgi:hypothetical protein
VGPRFPLLDGAVVELSLPVGWKVHDNPYNCVGHSPFCGRAATRLTANVAVGHFNDKTSSSSAARLGFIVPNLMRAPQTLYSQFSNYRVADYSSRSVVAH